MVRNHPCGIVWHRLRDRRVSHVRDTDEAGHVNASSLRIDAARAKPVDRDQKEPVDARKRRCQISDVVEVSAADDSPTLGVRRERFGVP